ncbi:MAG: ArsR/SmtB family transcription factor [Longimicrobiales bacterium]
MSRADLSHVWRALANPIRRRMLDILRAGPRTTGELAERFPNHSRFAVMQHLLVLEQGGLVVHHRQGRQRFNYLNPIPIQQIYDRWVSRYQQPWTQSLVGLKAALEEEAVASRDKRARTRSA